MYHSIPQVNELGEMGAITQQMENKTSCHLIYCGSYVHTNEKNKRYDAVEMLTGGIWTNQQSEKIDGGKKNIHKNLQIYVT